jgi:archaeal type IV pilus assembly protein PilA
LRIRNFSRGKRGIDTIIASLLMVVIVVAASVMVFVYATGLFSALLIPPRAATENLSLEYASFSPSNNNVTLFVRNTGSTPITLKSYYVKDSLGNVYARTDWTSGPAPAPGPFAPKTLASPNPTVLISSACGTSCTYTGTAFTFSPGNTYTVVLVTAINTQFSLSIVR